jgi:hypothetical protein
MKRVLIFDGGGVVGGYDKEEMVKIFPELETSFHQRKEFFEYYLNETSVEVTIDRLQALNDAGYSAEIFYDEIRIS